MCTATKPTTRMNAEQLFGYIEYLKRQRNKSKKPELLEALIKSKELELKEKYKIEWLAQ